MSQSDCAAEIPWRYKNIFIIEKEAFCVCLFVVCLFAEFFFLLLEKEIN